MRTKKKLGSLDFSAHLHLVQYSTVRTYCGTVVQYDQHM
jgi:hypothetical protein